MSTAALELRAAPAPDRVGQATAVEQSRAIAEVQAQVVVAQRMPRSVDRAVREMERSCARRSLAEKAFYRFPRAGGQVSGESIVLAKELARCWGNIDYGIAELRRDDAAGESEMMAYAWDLETNTRPRTTFIVPHLRDKKGGPERLADVRDIYENNANMGARRVREMIFNVLPPWFIEDAKELCYRTLAADDRDGATVGERAAKAVERFGRIGVRPEQLTQKLGAPQDKWSAADLARLTVIFKSIERGESSAEDEFGAPAARISAADLAPAAGAAQKRQAKKAAQDPPPAAAAPGAPPSPDTAPSDPPPPGETAAAGGATTYKQDLEALNSHLERLGVTDGEGKLRVASRIAGRQLAKVSDMSIAEARKVRDTLEALEDSAALDGWFADQLMDSDPRDVPGE